MTGYFCPVEGCEFGQHDEKPKASVNRHINAKAGEDHADVERLRALVDDQDEADQDDPGDDDPEADDDGSDASEARDPATEEEDEDMPSDEEYQQQYDQGQDDQDDDQGGDQADDAGGSFLPALDQRTMLMLVGLVVVLVLAYSVLGGDDSATVDVEETDDSNDSDDGGEVTLIE